MNVLIAASTNRLTYTPSTFPADSISVALADASGTAITHAATVTTGTDSYSLTLAHTEITVALVGQVCTATWTWTSGGSTLTDVESFTVTHGPLSHSDYIAHGGAGIAESEWPRYRALAEHIVAAITMHRSVDEHYDAYCDAISGAAQSLYAEPAAIDKATLVARMALSGTGLTYRGVGGTVRLGQNIDEWDA